MEDERKYNSDTSEVMVQFVEQLVALELEKKKIQEKIKELKADYKEEGIAVSIICRVFNRIKKKKKQTESEKFEEEAIQEILEESKRVDDAILTLVD